MNHPMYIVIQYRYGWGVVEGWYWGIRSETNGGIRWNKTPFVSKWAAAEDAERCNGTHVQFEFVQTDESPRGWLYDVVIEGVKTVTCRAFDFPVTPTLLDLLVDAGVIDNTSSWTCALSKYGVLPLSTPGTYVANTNQLVVVLTNGFMCLTVRITRDTNS